MKTTERNINRRRQSWKEKPWHVARLPRECARSRIYVLSLSLLSSVHSSPLSLTLSLSCLQEWKKCGIVAKHRARKRERDREIFPTFPFISNSCISHSLWERHIFCLSQSLSPSPPLAFFFFLFPLNAEYHFSLSQLTEHSFFSLFSYISFSFSRHIIFSLFSALLLSLSLHNFFLRYILSLSFRFPRYLQPGGFRYSRSAITYGQPKCIRWIGHYEFKTENKKSGKFITCAPWLNLVLISLVAYQIFFHYQ